VAIKRGLIKARAKRAKAQKEEVALDKHFTRTTSENAQIF